MKQADCRHESVGRSAALLQSPVQALLYPLTKLFQLILHCLAFLLRLLTVDLYYWLFQRRQSATVQEKDDISKLRERFAMANDNDGNDSRKRSTNSESDVESYQDFHRKGYDYISKALTMDEASQSMRDRQKAMDLYLQGIVELERGIIAIENVPPSVPEDRARRTDKLRDKMLTNLELARERVADLNLQIRTNKSTVPATTKSKFPFGSSTMPRTTSPAAAQQKKFNNAAKVAPVAPVSRRQISVNSRPAETNKPARSTSRGRLATRPSVSGRSEGKPEPSPRAPSTPSTPRTTRKNLGALKNVDSAMANLILDQIIDNSPGVYWDTIAGQQSAKQALQETVVWPALRPEVFTGLRAPAKGILLFGPPGNGKTLLAKAVATESKQTFFNISASTLTSKWVGEGEKLVRALFACARELQPSIIFIDEVDSILSARKDSEHDAIRRLKTEFLIQFDGVGTASDERILVMGATNLPQELDLAALRRFPKRIMISLPDEEARISMLRNLLKNHQHRLDQNDFEEVADLTEGYSGSDLAALAKDAAMGPIREIDPQLVPTLKHKEIRPITKADFQNSVNRIRPSVPQSSLADLDAWAQKFGDCT
ncbi:hypothetical protein RvY_01368 [Ramazzottius varieornatus]|uniref:microtubule-severing ATPase n=1 Tax=Ramazzottius varieornatus TaxID=947166 RepID=A0A1D1UG35_RAMVA|nr:hypothetical protein RvY_01368 [Ramazzottius varieornatus]